MRSDVIGLILGAELFGEVVFVLISMFILALYYSLFKRWRLYCQLKKELRLVLRHNNTLLERSWKDEPAVQKMCKEEVMMQHTGVQKQQEESCVDYDDDEILTMESATALLKSLGWSVEIEGGGDHLATYHLPDREVQFLYNDKKVKDSPQFDCRLVITSGILAAACQTLDPKNSETLPDLELNFEAKRLEIFEERVRVGHLKQALDEALKWAMKAVDLRKVLRAQYGTPPWERDETKRGHTALLHLGALALLGDVETLLSYRKSFAQGRRRGFEEGLFDTNIKEIHLEHAVVLAKESAKTKHLSYDLLERVEKELYRKPRSFLFEEAFLSAKTYKVICSFVIIILVGSTALGIPLFLEGHKDFFATVIGVQLLIMIYALILIPVMWGIHVFLGYLLEKNIQKLDEAIFKWHNISRL